MKRIHSHEKGFTNKAPKKTQRSYKFVVYNVYFVASGFEKN